MISDMQRPLRGYYRQPNAFWDRFKKTRTSRLYKGYRIDGDGKGFTVQGNRFDTMKEAQRWVDVEVREEAAHKRFESREEAKRQREEDRIEREQIRREKEQERKEASAKRKAAAPSKRKSSGGGQRRQRRHTGASVSSRYHGYRLQRLATGEWTVPQLDPGSRFEDKHEAKRFVDSEVGTMRRSNRGESTTSYTVHSSAGRKTFGYLKSARVFAQAEANRLGTSVGIDQNRHDGKRTKHYEVRPKGMNRRMVNPRTLVPAKLKMMPNGKIVVLLSPGAMAKMRNPGTDKVLTRDQAKAIARSYDSALYGGPGSKVWKVWTSKGALIIGRKR